MHINDGFARWIILENFFAPFALPAAPASKGMSHPMKSGQRKRRRSHSMHRSHLLAMRSVCDST